MIASILRSIITSIFVKLTPKKTNSPNNKIVYMCFFIILSFSNIQINFNIHGICLHEGYVNDILYCNAPRQ